MSRGVVVRASRRRLTGWAVAVLAATLPILPGQVQADEGGVSFWLPGTFGSLAATPQVPGWSMAEVYYHTSVSAFGRTAAAREIEVGRFPARANVDLNLRLNAQAISCCSIPLTRSQRRCWVDNLPSA